MTNTLPPTGENWEEKFDQLFGTRLWLSHYYKKPYKGEPYSYTSCGENVKYFIRNLLTDQTKRARVENLTYFLDHVWKWWAEWRAEDSHKLEYPDNSEALSFKEWVLKKSLEKERKG